MARGRTWWIAAGGAVLASSVLPYVWAAWTAPAGTAFGWGLGFLPDTLGNLIFARQAAAGAWLFADTYTAEPHPARFFHPYFLLVGWTMRATGCSAGAALAVWRVASAAALLHAVASACRAAVPREADARRAFLLVALSGGLGWLSVVFPWFRRSADLRAAELTTFASLYQQGHFAAALALAVWAMRKFVDACETGSRRAAAAAAACHAALVAVHPYDAPVTVLAAAGFAALRRFDGRPVPWRALALFAAAPAPLLAYDGWLAAAVPVYRDFAREGLRASFWSPVDYLLGWAPLLPLAAWGLARAWRERRGDPRGLLPAAWLAATAVACALPLPAQRKLLEGAHLFLALAAARGAAAWRPPWGEARRALAAAGLAAACGTAVYVVGRDVYAVAVSRRPDRDRIRIEGGFLQIPYDGRVDRWFYGDPVLGGIWTRRVDRYELPADLVAACRALVPADLPEGTGVLAAPETGLFVPILAPVPVVAGHLFETLDAGLKETGIRMVMDAALPDDSRRALLTDLRAGAILLDGRLARLGGWRPAGEAWLSPPVVTGSVRIYRVAPAGFAPAADRPGLRGQIDASYWKVAGEDREAAGDWAGAADAFTRGLALRPVDPELRAGLRRARTRAPVPPPR